MSARGERRARLYRALLFAYPRGFRAEYGDEMLRAFVAWRDGHARGPGSGGGRAARGDRATTLRFWIAVLGDVARSAPREWLSALRGRRARADGAPSPPYADAALAALAVALLYVATLAPTTGFWDSGEYITVAHMLGIPHPPGNPLFVLLAHAWEVALAPLGLSVAVRINLFSALLSAAAHGFWFLVVERALAGWGADRTARRIGAAAAVLLSATAFTVWNQSNVNEKVYTVSLFTTALVTWLALRWRDTGRGVGPLVLIAFIVALTATNHLMGVLVAPAIAVFVLLVDRRALLRPRFWATSLPLAAVALSVQLFLPLRAAQRPLVAEGDPRCESAAGAVASVYTWGAAGCDALSAVLQREQYAKPSILSDPTDPRMPRGLELTAAQFVNWVQYVDWQWARSVAGADPLFGGARPLVTLLFVLLSALGARAHWRSDRPSAALLLTLLLTLSAGLVLYLNFRYGYSFGRAPYPVSEVRERDYFFLICFSVMGLWAGIGLATAWRRTAAALAARASHARAPRPSLPRPRALHPRLLASPVLAVALVPLALNWAWASRADDYTPRDWAYNVLMSVEPYGVLVTNGDNDSFPLWYLQHVEGIREDVTIVLSPLLRTPWYARQLRDLTRPCPPGVEPSDDPTRIICQRPFDAGELPAPLVEAGWAESVDSPVDSILPLNDAAIERLGAVWFRTAEARTFSAGRLSTRIDAGTLLAPDAAFMAAILRATLGDRPIYFMPASSLARSLGLDSHVVRQGLVWEVANAPAIEPSADVVPMPAQLAIFGAAVDLTMTDTLLWDVYLKRGRILDPDAPWADHATVSIPSQYTYAHYAAAQAHALRGEAREAERHVREGDWWQGVALNTGIGE